MRRIGIRALCILVLGFMGVTAPCAQQGKDYAGANDIFTPVTLSVLYPPSGVIGTDGRVHLVYELQLINASRLARRIDSVEVRAAGAPRRVLASFTGKELERRINPTALPPTGGVLEPAQAVICWIEFSVPSYADAPAQLEHRVHVSAVKQVESDPGSLPVDEVGARVSPRTKEPLAIGPPLEGTGWLAANGCCDSNHRHAMMPINGRLYTAQRFAIDYVRVGKDGKIVQGSPNVNSNHNAYGQNAVAVQDAVVVSVLDGLPDRTPLVMPTDTNLQNATGNHVVLDLGNNHFAFYAHLKPGGIKVKMGQKVRRGQVLALVGNSGNTSGPHLHFHIMSSRSPLSSEGIPYVIDSFEYEGRATSDAVAEAGIEGKVIDIQNEKPPAARKNQMPMNLDVLTFPAGAKK
jgi:hypothetical protein